MLETSNLSDYKRSVMKPAQKLLRIRLRIDTRAFVTIYKIAVCRLNSRIQPNRSFQWLYNKWEIKLGSKTIWHKIHFNLQHRWYGFLFHWRLCFCREHDNSNYYDNIIVVKNTPIPGTSWRNEHCLLNVIQ